MTEESKAFTIRELYDLPAAVHLMTAARALHMGRTMAYDLVRRDEFPCRLLRYGGTYRVATADLLELLGVPLPEPGRPAAVESI
ncbi:MerR family transcriptional regulator [Nocardiopsis suaedae]|uniref:DNA-binding protein n=1 Tax=Nocardiopsis suaedae TaxID=3018444 RepID=A0ABT4TTP6_9ACTN|nr:DNA-binding protein [Nocardiopsis suaedae]MDA2808012.1 DNA-binding protein [Nocardiopsis suaedae]